MDAPRPLFLRRGDGGLSSRFAIFHASEGEPKGCVVQVHAFAEELNKTRRMAARQARAMAAAGYAVLQMDLLGCGDSAGDFGDATWAAWIDDVAFASDWLRRETHRAAAPWLWGVRAGCLLASAARTTHGLDCPLLFWQPTVDGGAVLRQFLRLHQVGQALERGSEAKESGGRSSSTTAPAPRARLDVGETVEIAGYRIRPELVLPLERATLQPPPRAGRCAWLEVSSREPLAPTTSTARAAAQWAAAGWRSRTTVVQGPAFWQTVEIEDADALIPATLAALGDDERAPS